MTQTNFHEKFFVKLDIFIAQKPEAHSKMF